ncbi:MAG: dihydropteroate synthase [Treponema sp.]|nr:dihydropteroate synthase [Treponema sp.]
MPVLQLKDRIVKSELPAFVMGIVNVTPDSFFKDSRGGVERALELIEEGADILDLGAESTRPGSLYISEDEEIERLIPVITEIRKVSDIPISVDTRKKNVMEKAFQAGADILNDISALEDDPLMADFCAKNELPVILMHKKGIPSSMQDNVVSENAFKIVNDYLIQRAEYALSAGIAKDKIILDPGIGFGKDLKANVDLIKNLSSLGNKKYPILMALSRKTCIGQMTGREVEDRLAGTLAADLLSVIRGASMVRVHDVKETVDTLKVLSYIIS